ncbi:AAA family ATPase [Nostocoides sp. HKS02]|nr:AAA family ATPase [Tetrasphaera sp. HKS02]
MARGARPVSQLLGAAEIAKRLDKPPPTPQQTAVIEAPLEPMLVVAGAGSGKTETMAGRVVWLVVNGLVDADQVLGLTFTRKAATELAHRINSQLRHARLEGLWTPASDDGSGAETLGGTVTVSTYHSYAGRLVREHALRLGYEGDSRLLSEAAAWQYASEVVDAYDGPMGEVTNKESTVKAAVVDFAGELAEHLRTPGEVTAYLDEVVARIDSLPAGTNRGGMPAGVKELRATLRAKAAVMPIVEEYLALKKRRDAMDFADQMALAARLARDFDDIGEIERARFKAVLLDEFQDTSEAQLELLRALFVAPGVPVPVTAVGDPNQSIYGWRGASATTLKNFPRLFPQDGVPAAESPLSTSWRNDRAILEVANAVAEPLRDDPRITVLELSPRADAGRGVVDVARVETIEDEAALVADWVAGHRKAGVARSFAVLCRKRSQFGPVIAALEHADLPYEVVGLGGLLITPEVQDVVALLHAVNDPTRGDQLMRLLTGPLCRLGPADLDGLAAWAREQQRLRLGLPAAPAEADLDDDGPGVDLGAEPGAVARPTDQAPDSAENASIVEAIDALPRPGWVSYDGKRIGPTARERLAELGATIRGLRGLTSLPLADLVGEAERALGLDIEVLTRPEYDSTESARAHLDAFADVAAGFSVSADRPTLGGFLAWLAAALKEERGLDKGYIETAADGSVQVLTVHAAKGLEWDVVAVPGLTEASFPAHAQSQSSHDGSDWVVRTPSDKAWTGGLSQAGIPFGLRGDREGLPVLDWQTAPDLKDLEDRVKAFRLDAGEYGVVEERRLAYVAFTRARKAMLLTAPIWADATTPRVTSRFLMQVVDPDAALPITVREWAPMPDPDPHGKALSPRAQDGEAHLWPGDPLRDRRAVVTEGAAAVRAALASYAAGSGAMEQPAFPVPGTALSQSDEIDLLLEERRRLAERGDVTVLMPRHLSASAVVSLAQDPVRFATALRRPMPEAPALAARRGTAFHAWVEQHFARAAMVDVLDLPGSADDDPADDAELPAMKQRFLASEWAHRTPAEIEIALETVIDGIAVRGRIDAVFARPPADGGGFTIVDWKTGAKPTGELARTRSLQLAAYRVAFARLRGLDPAMVDGAFYYAGTGETVRPELPDEQELADLLRSVPD